MGEGNSGGLCVCVYVESHLKFQFYLTGLLWEGWLWFAYVYVGSLLLFQLYRDWFEVDE